MRLFVEGATYDKAFLQDCLGGMCANASRKTPSGDGLVLDVVGYYYNKKHHIPYFILPKVFARTSESGEIVLFDNIEVNPHSSIDISVNAICRHLKNKGWQENIIYELPIWLYRAISKFRKNNSHKKIEQMETLQNLFTPKNDNGESTLLDIVLGLEEFFRQNKDLCTLIRKQTTYNSPHKINWGKTVSRQAPLFCRGSIVYVTTSNSGKIINYEDELLCIYFSTLRYIAAKFDPGMKVDVPYLLAPDNTFFRQTEQGIISKQLRALKGNYFSDNLQKLWKLLYAFHKKINDIHGNKTVDDYLLIKDFNVIFEDMVDELISDSNINPSLVTQKDGRIVDHLFRYDSLPVQTEKIYYVGDSKYYRDGNSVHGTALYKQFTYVKNIIQLHFDWYNARKEKDGEKAKEEYWPYRDDLTEGYNISPNFFISADVFPNDTLYVSRLCADEERNKELERKVHNQFPNRLFDRDTLFLRHFRINFLFVLYAYIHITQQRKNRFRQKAYADIKSDFVGYINTRYDFYKLVPLSGMTMEDVMNKTFRRLIGKVFCPDKNSDTLILALEKDNAENDDVCAFSCHYFTQTPYRLGD